MLQVVDGCDYKAYEQTGAFWVALIFLIVFVVLIVIDTVLTFTALRKALTKDERETEVQKRIKEKSEYLENLTRAIEIAQQKANALVQQQKPQQQPSQPLLPSYACDVLPAVPPGVVLRRDAPSGVGTAWRRGGLVAGQGGR